MMKIAVMGAAALLAGCSATAPVVAPSVVEVYKTVREPCIEKAPTKPTYRYGAGEMPGEKERAAVLIADFEAAEQYGTAWEAAAAGCIKPQQQPSSLPSTATLP